MCICAWHCLIRQLPYIHVLLTDWPLVHSTVHVDPGCGARIAHSDRLESCPWQTLTNHGTNTFASSIDSPE